jgi:SAM-dependent methyltransferase
MTLANWYDTPVYYDIIFAEDTAREADFLEAMMLRHGRLTRSRRPPWRILEPACGSGRLVAELSQRGHDVSGFDINGNMLAHARDRLNRAGLGATIWEDHLEAFKVPSRVRFDLAHCLVSTFKYLLTEAHAVSHLKGVASSLRVGGLYVVGLHLTDYHRRESDHERWVGQRDGIKVICNTRTWPAHRSLRHEDLRTRLQVTHDGRSHLQETTWQFRTYNAAEIKVLLHKVPIFKCVACHDFTYAPGDQRPLDDSYSDLILVLRKERGAGAEQ